MNRKMLMLTVGRAMAGGAVAAETHEVRMLNKGEAGVMVFEPADVVARPGDTIRVVPTDKGHKVDSIAETLPDEVAPFKSAFNAEYELTVGAEGLYGVKCTPDSAMGMVALIHVRDATNLDAVKVVKFRGKAAERFEDALSHVQCRRRPEGRLDVRRPSRPPEGIR